jgi:ERCC4-related helicase
MHAIGGWQTKCAVLQPYSGAVDPLALQQLEMERGVLGVSLEQPVVLVGKISPDQKREWIPS